MGRDRVAQATARMPERTPDATTQSGMPIKRLYTPEDGAQLDYGRDLGFPGEYPYTRGAQPTMYRAKPWTMRMFAGFGTAEETNARFKYLLAQGQTGLSVAFDMATLYGYDHDHPMALGEFGKCGVAVSSLADMEVLFKDIPLDQVTTSMTINSPGAGHLGDVYRGGGEAGRANGEARRHAAKRYPQGIHRAERVSLPAGAVDARWSWTPSSSARATCHAGTRSASAATTSARRARPPCRNWRSRWRTGWPTWTRRWSAAWTSTSSRPGSRSSSTCTTTSSRRSPSSARRGASGRARCASTIGAKDPRSWMLRTHAQTAGVSLTAQQPEINVVRVTIQALAAVLGGTNSLHTNSLDEALALPTEAAALTALRTQQIIAHESGVTNTIDPLGGSFFIEALTDETERQAVHYIEQIRELGGVLECIRNGFFQREIAEASYRFQHEVEANERMIVGVNDYVMSDEAVKVPTLYVDPARSASTWSGWNACGASAITQRPRRRWRRWSRRRVARRTRCPICSTARGPTARWAR